MRQSREYGSSMGWGGMEGVFRKALIEKGALEVLKERISVYHVETEERILPTEELPKKDI